MLSLGGREGRREGERGRRDREGGREGGGGRVREGEPQALMCESFSPSKKFTYKFSTMNIRHQFSSMLCCIPQSTSFTLILSTSHLRQAIALLTIKLAFFFT